MKRLDIYFYLLYYVLNTDCIICLIQSVENNLLAKNTEGGRALWKLDSKSSIYPQLANKIKSDIARGDLKMGERIQSVRDLAMEAGVNPNTMQKALSKLESEGYLYSENTSGRYVTNDEKLLKNLRKDMLEKIYHDVDNSLKSIGLGFDDFIELIKKKRGD